MAPNETCCVFNQKLIKIYCCLVLKGNNAYVCSEVNFKELTWFFSCFSKIITLKIFFLCCIAFHWTFFQLYYKAIGLGFFEHLLVPSFSEPSVRLKISTRLIASTYWTLNKADNLIEPSNLIEPPKVGREWHTPNQSEFFGCLNIKVFSLQSIRATSAHIYHASHLYSIICLHTHTSGCTGACMLTHRSFHQRYLQYQ